MNSYNKIEKFKYEKNAKDCVSLEEYIVFEDEQLNEKHILFKFINNLNQRLYAIRFEVCQYDKDENLLEKTLVDYDMFVANENEEFVPKAKLKANYECVSIQEKLIYAKYERVIFENGVFSPYTTTYEQERKNRQLEEINNKIAISKKKANAQRKLEEQASKTDYFKIEEIVVPKLKGNFQIDDITKRNKTNSYKVFNVISFLIVVAISMFFTIYFVGKTNTFAVGEFNYQFTGNNVQIVGFDHQTVNIETPEGLIMDSTLYKVSEIEKDAFANSNIKQVVIKGNSVINAYAFADCKKLTDVSGGATFVFENAFLNDSCLLTVDLPNALILANAFKGCDNINTFTFNNTTEDSFTDLFNSKLLEGQSITVNTIITNMQYISKDFFANVNCEYIYLTNKDVVIEDEAIGNLIKK